MQTPTTLDPTVQAPFGTFEQPLLLQADDIVPQDDDDAMLDSWLSSLGPREFELILSDLADDRMNRRYMLEPTA